MPYNATAQPADLSLLSQGISNVFKQAQAAPTIPDGSFAAFDPMDGLWPTAHSLGLSPVNGGRYFERPQRLAARARRPRFLLSTGKDAEPLLCGHETYRFSQTGAVELIREVVKTRRPITDEEAAERKAMKLGKRTTVDLEVTKWWCVDAIDGRKTELTDAVWSRLVIASPHLPGFGWEFLASPNADARQSPAKCCRCSMHCSHKGGDGPVFGGSSRKPNTLMHGEWAELRFENVHEDNPLLKQAVLDNPAISAAIALLGGGSVVSIDKAYVLCANCLPPNFVYCDWCKTIHRAWHTAEPLMRFDAMIKAWRAGELPKALYVREYGTGNRNKETGEEVWIRKPEHADDRLPQLLEYVGRAIVCARPSAYYQDNLSSYLNELQNMQLWYITHKQQSPG